jgi:3',5'-cyclic AMP phosphodiesterase CpdA
LDNATAEEFSPEQMQWFEAALRSDAADARVRTVVVGMHEALPDSLAENHSMAQSPSGVASGRRVYGDLLNLKNGAGKRVYVLASHSHYFMDGTFNTAYWREHGGVLPGWIIGTAGAVRYALPPGWEAANAAQTNVYGFLTGSVQADGSINFAFQRLEEKDVPAAVMSKYSPDFVHWCFAENSQAR